MLTAFIAITVTAAILVSPRAAVLMLVCPVLGLIFGGFCWALAAMACTSLVSLEAFAGFIAMATVMAGVLSLRK